MDISQANDNELQKAIDSITKNNDSGAAGTNELEAQIQNQMGVPPVPPVPEVTGMPVMPDATTVPEATQTVGADASTMQIPDMAATVPEAPVAEPTVPVPETTATEEAPTINPVGAPVAESVSPVADVAADEAVAVEVEPADKSGDFDSVKGAIVRDLYGLLDIVDGTPETKFEIVREMIEDTGDKSMIVKGYDIAKNISDEKEKAEALMFLFENA